MRRASGVRIAFPPHCDFATRALSELRTLYNMDLKAATFHPNLGTCALRAVFVFCVAMFNLEILVRISSHTTLYVQVESAEP